MSRGDDLELPDSRQGSPVNPASGIEAKDRRAARHPTVNDAVQVEGALHTRRPAGDGSEADDLEPTPPLPGKVAGQSIRDLVGLHRVSSDRKSELIASPPTPIMQIVMVSQLEQTINARRRVYLLRHGDVSYFDSDGLPYEQEAVPLNEEGIRQANAAAEALRDARFDRLVISGLPRTVQTADCLRAGRGVELVVHDDLREIAPGRMEDHDPAELEALFTSSLRARLERDTRFLGGETFGSLLDRVLRTFESLLADRTWKEMAIVAHGGTNRAILCRCLGAELTTFAALEQDPACINVIDLDESGACLVRLINFTPWSPTKHDLRATTMERLWMSHLAPRAVDDDPDGKSGSDVRSDPDRGGG